MLFYKYNYNLLYFSKNKNNIFNNTNNLYIYINTLSKNYKIFKIDNTKKKTSKTYISFGIFLKNTEQTLNKKNQTIQQNYLKLLIINNPKIVCFISHLTYVIIKQLLFSTFLFFLLFFKKTKITFNKKKTTTKKK